MKKIPLILLLLASAAWAQTLTFTTLQDGNCGKGLGYCTLAVLDNATQVNGSITIDDRQPYGGTLSITSPEFTGSAHGAYSGFNANPNGTKQDYDGTGIYSGTGFTNLGASFTATGSFAFHAHYNGVCQGRGCPTVGWFFTIKAGSTVAVQ
jgi:hypothetical protein